MPTLAAPVLKDKSPDTPEAPVLLVDTEAGPAAEAAAWHLAAAVSFYGFDSAETLNTHLALADILIGAFTRSRK